MEKLSKIFGCFLITCLLSSSLFVKGQTSDLKWTVGFGGSDADQGRSIVTDNIGNVYVTGAFKTSVDFDPGTNEEIINSEGSFDIFISKFDSNGGLLWVRTIGGTSYDYAMTLTTDNNQNIYVGGFFQSTMDFDPGVAEHNLSAISGSADAFILSLNSDGNFRWVHQFGNTEHDVVMDVEVDTNGFVYSTGHFGGTIDFDPGIGESILTAVTNSSVFVAKFDTVGNLIWAKQLGGPMENNDSRGIAVDGDGNVFTVGYFYGTGDFDPGPSEVLLTPDGTTDIFISKLDSDGNFEWVKQVGNDQWEIVAGVSVDEFGSCFITGQFKGTVDFNPDGGVYELTAAGASNYDVFILKLSDTGNFGWARHIGGSNEELSTGIALDELGNVYVIGAFKGNADFDPNPGATNYVTSEGDYDAFLLRLDEFGDYPWVKTFGGIDKDVGEAVTIDLNGIIHATGKFNGLANFDTLGGGIILSAEGGDDVFIMSMTLPRNLITGTVFSDGNGDCTYNQADFGRSRILVKAEPGPYYGLTDGNGDYYIYTHTGNYTVSQATQDNLWQQICGLTHAAQFTYASDVLHDANFPSQTLYSCSQLTVDIGTPFLRRCFPNTYHVSYCNTGTITAEGVGILFDWPSGISGPSSYTIGNLIPGECGQISIPVNASCSVNNGETLCAVATILPDTFCIPPGYDYDQRQIAMNAECVQNDSVLFTVSNTHDLNISQEGYYRLLVNNMLADEIPFVLNQGEVDSIAFPAFGNTVRMEMHFTTNQLITVGGQITVEACGGAAIPNIIGQLPDMDVSNSSTDCSQVIGSFDPNDKSVVPMGVTAMHYINESDDLEYRIRFQNTGTDTAFTVVIRDTISSYLDIATLTSGVSSHPYEFNIYGQGIAEWTFNDILLPDSNVNEPASHGFVKFKIAQLENNLPGTLIENEADIYFDFNEPIITNATQNIVYDTVLVCSAATPEFTYELDGQSVSFINNSINGDSYLWEFGDDQTSTMENPSHEYSGGSSSYTVCLNASNLCGVRKQCMQVDILVTGLQGFDVNEIALSPNPTNSLITITGCSPHHLRLENLLGQSVAEGSKTQTISLEGLPNGLYLLNLFDDQNGLIATRKVIKY
jgi:uncharacterized repeat protein (TIGR01451 family)